MKDFKLALGLKQLLFFVLLIYAVFTIVPAAIYGLSKLIGDDHAASVIDTVPPAGNSSAAQAPKPESEVSSSHEEDGEAINQVEQDTSSVAAAGAEEADIHSIPLFLDGVRLDFADPPTAEDFYFRIHDLATDEILTVACRDFLPAAVICEMPVSAPDEALKAQAVATYTYYLREKKYGSLENADFTCNTENWLIYVTKAQMQERWGEDFDSYYSKVKAITDAVYGEALLSDGTPICASYFAISAGSTESSENVWGGQLDYLQAVASPGDVFSDGYLSVLQYTPEELAERASASFPDASFDFDLERESWIGSVQHSPAGYIQTLSFCGIELKGTDFRKMLSLPSACFETQFDGHSFIFTIRGHGHGVGMSQAGAIYMAMNGSDYQSILQHYYPGTSLDRLYA